MNVYEGRLKSFESQHEDGITRQNYSYYNRTCFEINLRKFLHLKGNTPVQIKAELDAVYRDFSLSL
jgi:hypothetical protein